MPRWARALLRAVRLDPLETQRRRLARIAESSRDVMRIQGVRVNARWLRELIAHDPRPALRRITVPVLAITGAHDVQVPPADIDMMRELIPGPFEGHVVAGVNHLLRPDPHRRGPRGYRRSARDPLAPAVLELITDWVSRTVPVPRPAPAARSAGGASPPAASDGCVRPGCRPSRRLRRKGLPQWRCHRPVRAGRPPRRCAGATRGPVRPAPPDPPVVRRRRRPPPHG